MPNSLNAFRYYKNSLKTFKTHVKGLSYRCFRSFRPQVEKGGVVPHREMAPLEFLELYVEEALPSPATHAIWTGLKAGETADVLYRV